MKFKLHRVFILVATMITGVGYLVYFTPASKEICAKMSAEVQSTSKQTDLMAFAKKVAGMNSLDTVFGDSFGFVNHDQLVDKTLYDHRLLDAMTIPPTIALVGHNIDYKDLSQSKIEAVAIGLGQRAFILIDVDKNGIFHGPSPVYSDDEVEVKIGDFMVVCRSPNNQ